MLSPQCSWLPIPQSMTSTAELEIGAKVKIFCGWWERYYTADHILLRRETMFDGLRVKVCKVYGSRS